MAKKTIVLSAFLTLVVLTASLIIYFNSGTDFKVDIQNTRTQYSQFINNSHFEEIINGTTILEKIISEPIYENITLSNGTIIQNIIGHNNFTINETINTYKTNYIKDEKWVLAATEYVYLYSGTTKLRAISRNLTWYNDSENLYAVRISEFKDNISTKQTYTFKIDETNIENVPIENKLECFNCENLFVQFEVRDISYSGETKKINSPFKFGNKMQIEWLEDDDFSWAKVYQQSGSDKIVVKFKADETYEDYYVKITDPKWWNESWIYISEINISETQGLSLNNFGVNITIDTGSLVDEGKLQADCDDVRFINSTGDGELKWANLTACNSSTTSFYVETNISASKNNTIYFYYGNSEATNPNYGTDLFYDSTNKIVNTNWMNVTFGTTNSDLPMDVLFKQYSVSLDMGGTGVNNAGTIGFNSRDIVVTVIQNTTDNITLLYDYKIRNNGGGADILAYITEKWEFVPWRPYAKITINSTYSSAGDFNRFLRTSSSSISINYTNGTSFASTTNNQNYGPGNFAEGAEVMNKTNNTNAWITYISGKYYGFSSLSSFPSSQLYDAWARANTYYCTVDGGSACYGTGLHFNNQGTNAGPLVFYLSSANSSGALDSFFSINFNPTIYIGALTIDLTNPSVFYNPTTEEDGSYLNRDYALVNISASDTNLHYVRLNWNGTNETFETNEGDSYWENKTSLTDGIYTLYGWANDSAGNYNFTSVRTIIIDTINPEIAFLTPNINNSVVNSYIEVEVDVNETNPKNITYQLSNLTDVVNITNYLMSTDTSNTSINFTDLPDTTYLINVSTYDLAGNFNSTETRYVTLTTFNMYFNNISGNNTAELGSNLSLIANSTTNISLCIDINHPSFGVNYACGYGLDFNFVIDWFRNTLFSSGNEYQELEFNYINETTNESEYSYLNFSIPVHQYDYIENLSINISGNVNVGNNSNYSNNITIYNPYNNSIIERVIYGDIIGSYVNIDKMYNPTNSNLESNLSLSFSNEGYKNLYLLVSENSLLNNLSFSMFGNLYGFDITEQFVDYSSINESNTNASVLGGFLIPGGDNPTNFSYDIFNSSINTTLWSFQTTTADLYPGIKAYIFNGSKCVQNGVIYASGCYDGYDLVKSNTETETYIETRIDTFHQAYSSGNSGDENIYNFIFTNWTKINSFTPTNMFTRLEYGSSGTEKSDSNNCRFNSRMQLGGVDVWQSKFTNCKDDTKSGADDCIESAYANITINLERQISNSWKVTLGGYETNTYEWHYYYAIPTCGTATKVYNYTNNSLSISYTFPSAYCVNSITSLENEYYIYDLETDFNGTLIYDWGPTFNTYIYGSYVDETNEGCLDVTNTYLRIYELNQTLLNLTNSVVESTVITEEDSNIDSVVYSMKDWGYTEGYTNKYEIYLSNDGGETFEEAFTEISPTEFIEEEYSFLSTGTELKYRINMTLDEAFKGYTTLLPFWIDNITFYLKPSYPSNITIDIGEDGVIDYSYSGSLNNSTGLVNITIPSNVSLDGYSAPYLNEYVPVSIYSNSSGLLRVSNINLTYNPNPIYLNTTSTTGALGGISNFSNLNITIGGVNGTLNITNLNYDYAGGNKTYLFTLHDPLYTLNLTRNLTYYFSQWDYNFIPTDVNYILFNPKNNTAKNVIPYGQGNSTPILNITNLGYGGKNATLSFLIDNPVSCVNTTISTTNNKSNGFIVNNTFQNLVNLTYLQNSSIWLWSDYACSGSTWRVYQPNFYFRQCCEDCLCSEEII